MAAGSLWWQHGDYKHIQLGGGSAHAWSDAVRACMVQVCRLIATQFIRSHVPDCGLLIRCASVCMYIVCLCAQVLTPQHSGGAQLGRGGGCSGSLDCCGRRVTAAAAVTAPAQEPLSSRGLHGSPCGPGPIPRPAAAAAAAQVTDVLLLLQRDRAPVRSASVIDAIAACCVLRKT